MKNHRLFVLTVATMTVVVASPALAHPGHGGTTFAAGLIHPLTGADHILAMSAVGLLAARRGGKALVFWPLTFVAAMLLGYAFGVQHILSLSVEPAILASVIVLGALAASSIQAPFAAGLCVIAFFGVCHGFAHGAEAPAGAGIGFPLGFAISTIALHGLGVALGLAALQAHRPALLRLLGGGIVLGGVVLAVTG